MVTSVAFSLSAFYRPRFTQLFMVILGYPSAKEGEIAVAPVQRLHVLSLLEVAVCICKFCAGLLDPSTGVDWAVVMTTKMTGGCL